MRISFGKHSLPETGVVVFLSYSDKKYTPSLKTLDERCENVITKSMKIANFKGNEGESVFIMTPANTRQEAILVVGMGKKKVAKHSSYMAIGGKIYTALAKYNFRTVSVVLDKSEEITALRSWESSASLAYGALLESYQFDKYKTDEKSSNKQSISHFKIMCYSNGRAATQFATYENTAKGSFLASDVLNEPGNVLYPETYANLIKEELSPLGVDVKIFDENDIQKFGMGAFYAVGRGSVRPPRMVVMHLNNDTRHAPVGLVGKGITFDSGGISIKPSSGMEHMVADMGGSAAVIGTMKALALSNANVNVIAIVGLAENMPDGNSTRPGDIVTTMSGKTVEIINTDAEGRLVLADCISYIQKEYKPRLVLDMATLTGAMVTALGGEYAGIFSNNDEIAKNLTIAGEIEEEKVWQLPLHKNYDVKVDSKRADIRNSTNSRAAGATTAAQFIQRFVEKDTNWIHVDIAGVCLGDWNDTNSPGYRPFGVRLLTNFIITNYESRQ